MLRSDCRSDSSPKAPCLILSQRLAKGCESLTQYRNWTSSMLVELRAENYAVIDHAIAVFGPGLNLLTGETGAGKSILVDALALLMGGKASAELVRHGADKAVVACVFESTAGAETILEENGCFSLTFLAASLSGLIGATRNVLIGHLDLGALALTVSRHWNERLTVRTTRAEKVNRVGAPVAAADI